MSLTRLKVTTPEGETLGEWTTDAEGRHEPVKQKVRIQQIVPDRSVYLVTAQGDHVWALVLPVDQASTSAPSIIVWRKRVFEVTLPPAGMRAGVYSEVPAHWVSD